MRLEGGSVCGRQGVVGRWGRTVVIEVEEDCQQDGEWDGEEDVADGDVPEIDQPTSIFGRDECCAGWQGLNTDSLHVADVDESGKENDGERCAVVFYKFSNMSLEEFAFANDATSAADAEHEE